MSQLVCSPLTIHTHTHSPSDIRIDRQAGGSIDEVFEIFVLAFVSDTHKCTFVILYLCLRKNSPISQKIHYLENVGARFPCSNHNTIHFLDIDDAYSTVDIVADAMHVRINSDIKHTATQHPTRWKVSLHFLDKYLENASFFLAILKSLLLMETNRKLFYFTFCPMEIPRNRALSKSISLVFWWPIETFEKLLNARNPNLNGPSDFELGFLVYTSFPVFLLRRIRVGYPTTCRGDGHVIYLYVP